MRRLFAAIAVTFATIAVALAPAQVMWAEPADDSTAALQAQFDQLKPGDTLTLNPGVYQHSGILRIRVPGIEVNGNGATLNATNDPTSAVQIAADNVSLNNINLTAALDGPRYRSGDQHKLLIQADGVTLSDVTINGSAAAGVYIAGSNNFRLDRVTVRNTRADGIAMADGASNGQLNNPVTERTGDDGISIVSYTKRYRGYSGPPCHDIVVNSPIVNGTTQARGLVVAGGDNISFHDINVSGTASAGVLIVSVGDPIFTSGVNGVEIVGGTISNANTAPRVIKGAIAIYSGYLNVANVSVSDVSITDTSVSAERNITVDAVGGGTVGNNTFRNIQFKQQADLPAFNTDAPLGSYTASGLTVNGTPIASP